MESTLIYLFEVSICLLLAYPVYYLAFSKLTFFNVNRLCILFLIIASLITPLLSFDFHESAPTNTSFLLQTNLSSTVSDRITLNGKLETTSNYLFWFSMIYLSGAIWAFFKLGYQLKMIFDRIKASSLEKKNGITLAVHPKHQYASFFRYIFFPEPLNKTIENQQAYLHESVHVQKRHSWDVLFLAICKAVLWFHPMIYLFDKSIKEVHEFEADKMVSLKYSTSQYARHLVELASQKSSLAIMHNFNYSPIKNRIIMMNKTKSNQWQKARFLLLIPVLAVMSMLFSFDSNMDQTKKLTGTWTGTSLEFQQSAGPDIKAMIEGGKDLHINGKLTLNKDFSYVIKNPAGETNGSGKWTAKGSDSFTTIDQNGEKTIYQVLTLERDKMTTAHQVQMATPQGEVKGKIILTYRK
ncbi:M56 family metallopeptidase [Echinicola sp. CAU 1574]|uniref:M56 family metallopeptidase n=1 Tax=Echinicola arenosa TaxID=2774144 RepID=A0ABR9AJS6_9BACT|nr:M56 family metallopeptidase [Echinicola arenosa]MBD8488965.1 M56 family metallopeptidase [Echinicola arenosa]